MKAVYFEINGIRGFVDENNWVTFGSCGFHLDDITEDSPTLEAIRKAREHPQLQP